MSEQFDISTNRIQYSLLTPEEREALEEAMKVPGARVEYWTTFYGKSEWRPCFDSPGVRPANVTFRVHLPAVEQPKVGYWQHLDIMDLQCKTVDGVIRDHTPSARIHLLGVELSHQAWVPITDAEYEAAKAKASGKPADAAPDAAPVETWEYEGKRYKLVPDSGPRCEGCVFFDKPRLCGLSPNCGDGMRPDGKNMIFVEDAPAPVPPDAPKPTRIEPLTDH